MQQTHIDSYRRDPSWPRQDEQNSGKSTALVTLICLLLAIGLLSLSGCGGPGIKPEAIQGTLERVSARHDAYVLADPALDGDDRVRHLRDTELLRKVVQTALDEAEPDTPTE